MRIDFQQALVKRIDSAVGKSPTPPVEVVRAARLGRAGAVHQFVQAWTPTPGAQLGYPGRPVGI
jgi:hypothetical protein